MKTIESTYTVNGIADLDSCPPSVQSLVLQVWNLDRNTFCLLTDHDFTEAEAVETLKALLA